MKTLPHVPLQIGASLLVLCVTAASNANGIRTVALSGWAAPGADPGVAFDEFGAVPTINNRGDVAFHSSLSNAQGSVWTALGGASLQLITTTADSRLGAGFESLSNPTINDSRQIAFYTERTGNAAVGVWIADVDEAGIELITRRGEQAPGTGSGVTFDGYSSGAAFSPSRVRSPHLSTSDEVVFYGELDLVGPGVDGTNSRGIWRSSATGSTELVVRLGDAAPGAMAGEVVNSFVSNFNSIVQGPAIDAQGTIAFAGSSGPPASGIRTPGLWTYSSETGLSQLAAKGDAAPVTTIEDPEYNGFGTPLLNSRGDLIFMAAIINQSFQSGEAILRSTEGGPIETVIEPGGVANIRDGRSTPVLNANGRVAFQAFSWSLETTGIWSERIGGAVESVALSGEAAPGLADGVVFNNLDQTDFASNANSQVAFIASFSGQTNSRGIWAESIDGALELIAHTGGLIDVDSGPGVDEREVSNLRFLESGGSGNDDGRPSSFNDLGQVVFQASFTDGSSGIFVSNAVALNGDYNSDGIVNAADYTVWRDTLGTTGSGLAADGDRNGTVDTQDFELWRSTYGLVTVPDSRLAIASEAVPEPSCSAMLLLLGTQAVLTRCRRKSR